MFPASVGVVEGLLMEQYSVAILIESRFQNLHQKHVVIKGYGGWLVTTGHLVLVHCHLFVFGFDWDAQLNEFQFCLV